jgi:hypothetical protein
MTLIPYAPSDVGKSHLLSGVPSRSHLLEERRNIINRSNILDDRIIDAGALLDIVNSGNPLVQT